MPTSQYPQHPSMVSMPRDKMPQAMATNTLARPLTKPQRMAYRIGRGETLVLTFEPYKSEILPLWRFKTLPIARKSSLDIWNKFLQYESEDDFVGMDMSRKFLQMGMTRAKRYANHKGGRKYNKDTGQALAKCAMGEKEREKLECSMIFRDVWERAKNWKGYLEKKELFLKEQKEWDKLQTKAIKEKEILQLKDDDVKIKQGLDLDDDDDEENEKKLDRSSKPGLKRRIKEEHTNR